MMQFMPILLMSLGFGLISISPVEAKNTDKTASSYHFLFDLPDGSTWQLEDIPQTKGKSMSSLCVPVIIYEQPPSPLVGEGKVCLSGQKKGTAVISQWDLTLFMNFKTNDTLVVHLPNTFVVNLTRAMTTAPRFHPTVISGASQEGTNPILSGTGKFQGAHGMVEVFGVFDTQALESKDNGVKKVKKYPFLGDLPVLGALFRSTSFQK